MLVHVGESVMPTDLTVRAWINRGMINEIIYITFLWYILCIFTVNLVLALSASLCISDLHNEAMIQL